MKNLSTPKSTSPELTEEDEDLDLTLRPKTWDDYVGQEKIKKNLQIIIKAAQKRNETIDHLLFYGGSGLGKTTLSYLVAKELKADIRVITGPTIKNTGDLAAILTNLKEGDILFCDEIHRLNKAVEEFIYPAIEDFRLNLILGKGPMARTMELKLPRFILIGATTRLASLSAPLRSRFGAIFQLNYYQKKDIEDIIKRSSRILKIKIEPNAIELLAKCSRFTPRVANRLLKRVRDFAQIEGNGVITEDITKKGLEFLEIDEIGLEPGDRRILEAIIEKFNGGPVGIQTLAAATSEEIETILDIYEPYLMRLGFIERTPRGRVATKLAYQHLKMKHKENKLF
ncbi:MAG TPA: Holliday junction branch migration DNA helicase RuvB [Candidatus Parcubacteria bacterium]|nr:Holliday junction branch migration DNA helicase RuvB [Candidatus Parcubacteria bacterium]